MRNEIAQLFDLIDLQKIREISQEYFENDPSVQNLMTYLRSEEFKQAWNIFASSSEIEDIIQWMKSHGVFVERELEILAKEFELITPGEVFLPASSNTDSEHFSVKTFEDELKQQIRLSDMKTLVNEFLKDGSDFAHLYLILELTRPALEKIFESSDIQLAIETLSRFGVDVEYLKLFVYNILRWN